jgi:hypothetical protein
MNSDQIAAIAVEAFHQSKMICMWFVLPLFLLRVTFGAISGDSQGILQAIKGVVFFFILIALFPPLLEFIFLIPKEFNVDVFTATFERPKSVLVDTVPWALKGLLAGLAGAIYWFCYSILVIVVILLASFAPIVFLFSTTFGIGFGLKVFFGLLVAVASWPIVWVALDRTFQMIVRNPNGSFGNDVIEILFLALKAIGPLSLAWMSMSSGPGQMAVGLVAGAAKKSFGAGLSSSKNMLTKGDMATRALAGAASGFNRLTGRDISNGNANPWRRQLDLKDANKKKKRDDENQLLARYPKKTNTSSPSKIVKNSSGQSSFYSRKSPESSASSQSSSPSSSPSRPQSQSESAGYSSDSSPSASKSGQSASVAEKAPQHKKVKQESGGRTQGSQAPQVSHEASKARHKSDFSGSGSRISAESRMAVSPTQAINSTHVPVQNRKSEGRSKMPVLKPYDPSSLSNFEEDIQEKENL